MTNPYSPPKSDAVDSRLSRTSIFVWQVLVRQASPTGIMGFAMVVVCAIVCAIHLFACALCLMFVWQMADAFPMISPRAIGAPAIGAMLRGGGCFCCSLLAIVSMRFWWLEKFGWGLLTSALLGVLSYALL